MAETSAQAVVFQSAMEGLGRSFRRRLTPQALEELRQLGIDIDRLQAAYPREVWEQALRLVARTLYSDEAEEVAWRKLGRDFMTGYTETMVGKAIVGVGRVMGPVRFLARAGRSFRSACNYANLVAEQRGPNEMELVSVLEPEFLERWRNCPTPLYHYRQGMLEAGLKVVGVQAEVELVSIDPERQVARYRARWR